MTQPCDTLAELTDACQAVVPFDLWRQHRAVVAVSGGADSVALFRAIVSIAQAQGTDCSEIVVGHVDHAVRGDDSRADRIFVEELASSLGVQCVSVTLDIESLVGQREKASEDLLREARYNALKQIARQANARYLFTGHHRDDQAETILFRIFRGTGLAGLKGIPALRRDEWLTIVRPFLKIPKSTILKSLAAIDESFRSDATNASNEFGRNFIRNELLVQARDYFGDHVDQAIVGLAQHAGEAIALEASLVDSFFETSTIELAPEQVVVPMGSFADQPATLIRAILIRIWQRQGWSVSQMTFERWQALAQRISTASAAEPYVENLPGDLRFEVAGNSLQVTTGKSA